MDFGLRTLGLALSDEGRVLATPLRVVRIRSVREAPASVAAVADEVGAQEIVVGVPIGLEGEERRREVIRVERFARALRKLSEMPVHLEDESLSTREAEDPGRRAARPPREDAVHARAAAVILQRWLDRRRAATRRSEEGR